MSKYCNGCTPETATVPFIVHEAAMARQERGLKRVWIALIVAVAMLFASNALWLWAWTQYDYTTTETTYTQDGQGTNIIGDNNTYNGTDSHNTDENTD